MTQKQADPPPCPARPRFRLEDQDGILWIRYRRRQWGPGCFLSVWLTGWTAGCVMLIFMVVSKPELFSLLFALPFWAAWCVVAYLVLTMLFQTEDLAFDENGIHYRKLLGLPVYGRTIPRRELIRFECSETTNIEENDAPIRYVEVLTTGRPLLLFPHLPEADRVWLTWALNEKLRSLPALNEPPSSHREPPSDCSWTLREEYDALVFLQRGRTDPVVLFGTLFLCLFWNGIVSVFVLVLLGQAPGDPGPQLGGEWWGLFWFLIPFEIIGLVFIGIFLLALGEPLRRTQWRLERDEISCRWSWLGVGRTWRYEVTSLTGVQLELRESTPESSIVPWKPFLQTTSSRQVQLRLAGENKWPLAILSGLTEGEAYWMRDRIETFYAATLRRNSR